MKTEMTCEQCGKKFMRYQCQQKPGTAVMCSQKCLHAHRRHGSSVKCARCGKSVYRRFGEQDIGTRVNQFCSRACYMDERRDRMKDSSYPKTGGTHIHRVEAERKAGRTLKPGEIVHHIDGNKRNYKSDNLMIFASQAEHAAHHARISGLGKRK